MKRYAVVLPVLLLRQFQNVCYASCFIASDDTHFRRGPTEMKTGCVKCGAEVDDTATFCMECGSPLAPLEASSKSSASSGRNWRDLYGTGSVRANVNARKRSSRMKNEIKYPSPMLIRLLIILGLITIGLLLMSSGLTEYFRYCHVAGAC
jgi:hypothetical protein